MSDDVRFERLLADVLADGAPARAPGDLVPYILAAAGRARRRPRWLALAAERPMRVQAEVVVGSPTLRWAYLVGLAILVAILTVSTFVAGGIVRPPDLAFVVPPSPSPSALLQTSAPSPSAELPRQVAYHRIRMVESGDVGCATRRPEDRCFWTRVWISSVDGRKAYELLPDVRESQTIERWTPDGTRLFLGAYDVNFESILYQVDLSGAEPQVSQVRCDTECAWGADAYSSDGQKVVYVEGRNDDPAQFDPTHNIVATRDLASGRVRELESTLVDLREGSAGSPRWSPDGTRIVYVANGNKFVQPSPNALFVVDADGNNLREIVPAGLGAEDPRWSPDGSRIVFSTTSINVGEDAPEDLYTVRPDGTDLRRLTSDGFSRGATWTADGRIVFVRVPLNAATDVAAVEVWVMDADGGNFAQLDANDAAAMTAANCVSCPYPLADLTTAILQGLELPNALWQPQP